MNRRIVQIIAAVVFNGHFTGFLRGTVYNGSLKKICVPVLNCTSCPGALGSCPLGLIQSSILFGNYQLLLLITGILLFLGGLLGRFICGWLCPFGFVQELLYKLPLPKYRPGRKLVKLNYLKYVVLVLFVFLFPALGLTYLSGSTFCKFLCPVETLEAYLPLMAVQPSLITTAGFLFKWKLILLAVFVVLAMIVFRPFCRYICPLGAVYGLFNRFSLLGLESDRKQCKMCGACQEQCELGIDVANKRGSPECIRCTQCFAGCQDELLKIKVGLNLNALNLKKKTDDSKNFKM
ncbi:MAG: 4Fe-4S binding protein [Pelotomaculaceae bacterium]|nr:4Fe-4S binding protein [Bacillota bacterium]HHU87534.1 4Fe-4S binding protein [Peptococcaceae bacterium]